MAIYDGRIDDLLSSTAPDTTEQARELLLSLPVSEQGYYLEMNAAHAVAWRSLCAWAEEHVGQYTEMGALWEQARAVCDQALCELAGTPRLVLVSCSGPKRTEKAPAAELYTSPLFVKARGYAEASGAPWGIVSGGRGLLWPETETEPYDVHLGDLSRSARAAWAEQIASEIGLAMPGAVAELLAGAVYTEVLRPALEAKGWAVTEPLRGLQIGQRLRWFGHQGAVAPSRQQDLLSRAS